MEVKEAARRILWHYKLLILFVVTGGLMSLGLRGDGGPTYVASSRLVVATDVESDVAADSVAGIATSEARIAQVLAGVNIDRDPGSVASRVSITPIGSSDIVELAVRDPDPDVAVVIARGLSTQVIEVMRRSGLAQAPLPYLVNTADISTTRAVFSSSVQDVALGALVGLFSASCSRRCSRRSARRSSVVTRSRPSSARHCSPSCVTGLGSTSRRWRG